MNAKLFLIFQFVGYIFLGILIGLSFGFVLNSAPSAIGINPDNILTLAIFMGVICGLFWNSPIASIEMSYLIATVATGLFAGLIFGIGVGYMSGYVVGFAFGLSFFISYTSEQVYRWMKAKNKKIKV